MPPSDFSGRAGRCGVQIWPFLCSGLPLSISWESAATVAVTPDCDSCSASSRAMSRPATGFRPAAARSRADAAPPMEVPRAVLVGADERSGIFFLGFAGAVAAGAAVSASRAMSAAQSETLPDSGTPVSWACGASPKPGGCSGSEASWKSVSGLLRRRPEASCGSRSPGGLPAEGCSGRLAMALIWEGLVAMGSAAFPQAGRRAVPADSRLAGGRQLNQIAKARNPAPPNWLRMRANSSDVSSVPFSR